MSPILHPSLNAPLVSGKPIAQTPSATRPHGGNDVWGQPEVEFSSNANACGPCPMALQYIQKADPSHYPEPGYLKLRQRLAHFHGVAVERVLVAASGSEFIVRITALALLQHRVNSREDRRGVWLPPHAYADYAQAAMAYQLPRADAPEQAALVWCCDPSSPLGLYDAVLPHAQSLPGIVVLDRAYEPLRLQGKLPVHESVLDHVWQLWTPNKALGLPGIRAAYAIAPTGAVSGAHPDARQQAQQLEQLAASWLLGAHGLAMLEAWVMPPVQAWVQASLPTLREWKAQQIALCTALGFECLPSHANFFTARPPGAAQPEALLQRIARLRSLGIKLREASSFGLPGHMRLSVQPPAAQAALRNAWLATV